MLALTLAFAFSTTAQVDAAAGGLHMRAITWSVFGVQQTVRVASNDARPWELTLESQPNVWLRSIVGPFFSTVEFRDPDADGLHHTARVLTRIDGDVSFDLVTWLDESGQSGSVLAELLSGPRCSMEGQCQDVATEWPDHPHCPSSDSLRTWDGGMLELSRMLVETECFTDAQVGIQADAFWIDDWSRGVVTLAIQREFCSDQSSECQGEVSFVHMTAPAAWRPWLDAAARHEGHLPKLAPVTPDSEESERLPSLAQR